jgi:hypothetical protein
LRAACINHKHVAFLEHIDRGLVSQPRKILRAPGGGIGFADVRPGGHHLQGQGAADQPFLGMQNLPPGFPLIAKSSLRQAEDLLGRHVLQLGQQIIRHFGPAVRESVERVLGRILQ